MIPFDASIFVQLPDQVKADLLRSNAVPVNDIFLPLWETILPKIVLLYGSYGSGKSMAIADRLLDKCKNQPYFRCYFGRNVLEDVRGSVHKTLVDEIRTLHLEDEFSFSDAPTGSMVITHKATRNEFRPFGASDPASLKSIKDPTDFFLEELDQFDFEDFALCLSRLRTIKADTRLWAAFNTEKVYSAHWIRKILLPGDGEERMEIPGFDFRQMIFSLMANFPDNYFLNREEYEKTLWLSAGGDAAKFNSIARGQWGQIRTGDEFFKQFSETRHVKPAKYQPGTIHVSLDENVNPYVTVSCWQLDTDAKQLRQVHEIPAKSPDNNAPKAAKRLADWLHTAGHKDVVYLYGDPSASKRSTIDANNQSFYDKFIEVMRTEGFHVTSRVQRSAPEVALSAAFINAIYESNLFGWSIIIGDHCFKSIEDYIQVKEDQDGKMLKTKVKDKESGVTYEPFGHFSDAKRYFITTVLASEFAQFKTRGKRRGPRDIPG